MAAMMRAMVPPLLRLILFLSTTSASAANSSSPISTGTADGSERWGYVVPRPGVHMFWLWYKSPHRVRSPAKPWPTVLWLQGGPGGSSVGRGNFLEIGSLYITMKRRPCTWLHVADLIFVDSPVGVGFSYADHPSALVKSDKQAVSDLLGVIQELIRMLQRLQSSPVYVVGESYGGKMAAMLGLVLERAIRDGTMNLTLGGNTAAVQTPSLALDKIEI